MHIVFSFSPVTFLCLTGWPGQGESFAIWQELTPATILKCAGHRDNRIISLKCEQPREGLPSAQFTIVFELFGAQSNAYLLDAEGVIVQAARVVSDPRALRPRSQYVAPPGIEDIPASGSGRVAEFGNRRYTVEYDGDGIQLQGESATTKSATPIVSLLQNIQSQFHERMRFEAALKDHKGRLRRLIGKQRQLIAQLQKQLDECNQAEQFARYGDLLMAHPHAKPVNDTLTVNDFYTNQQVVIPLEPGKTVIETAGIYYKRSKKLQRSIQPLKDRISQSEVQISQFEEILAKLENVENELVLAEILSRYKMKSLTAALAKAEQPTSRYYRIFESFGRREDTGREIIRRQRCANFQDRALVGLVVSRRTEHSRLACHSCSAG